MKDTEAYRDWLVKRAAELGSEDIPSGRGYDMKATAHDGFDRAQERAVAAAMRKFESGATRDTDEGKLDYEGFLSPVALEAFAQYMHKNRVQSDGQLRASDNWQKGIPRDAYMKSMFRHFMDVWMCHRDVAPADDLAEALCALLFNVQGYLHEVRK